MFGLAGGCLPAGLAPWLRLSARLLLAIDAAEICAWLYLA